MMPCGRKYVLCISSYVSTKAFYICKDRATQANITVFLTILPYCSNKLRMTGGAPTKYELSESFD